MKEKITPFEEYYKVKLEKDVLTDYEFANMIKDWLLGFSWYIVDPVGNAQGNRIILDEIMKTFPQKKSKIKEDKWWLDDLKAHRLQAEMRERDKGGK